MEYTTKDFDNDDLLINGEEVRELFTETFKDKVFISTWLDEEDEEIAQACYNLSQSITKGYTAVKRAKDPMFKYSGTYEQINSNGVIFIFEAGQPDSYFFAKEDLETILNWNKEKDIWLKYER